MPITVNITGPGGTICYEAEIIRRALEDALCTIVKYNDLYYPPEKNKNMDKFIYDYRQKIASGMITKEIEIHVNHEPWGG